MAKGVPPRGAEPPDDFAQVEPEELFPTNNIRFVMWETAKLTERVGHLATAIDKLGPSFDRALEKHAADIKERVAEIKADKKDSDAKIAELKTSADAAKGAMRVFAGIYALGLVLVAAFLAWYLRPAPAPTVAVPPAAVAPTVTNAPAARQ